MCLLAWLRIHENYPDHAGPARYQVSVLYRAFMAEVAEEDILYLGPFSHGV